MQVKIHLKVGRVKNRKFRVSISLMAFIFAMTSVYEVVSSLQKKRDIGDLKVLGTNEKGALENSRETHKVRQISGSHWQPGAG